MYLVVNLCGGGQAVPAPHRQVMSLNSFLEIKFKIYTERAS